MDENEEDESKEDESGEHERKDDETDEEEKAEEGGKKKAGEESTKEDNQEQRNDRSDNDVEVDYMMDVDGTQVDDEASVSAEKLHICWGSLSTDGQRLSNRAGAYES